MEALIFNLAATVILAFLVKMKWLTAIGGIATLLLFGVFYFVLSPRYLLIPFSFLVLGSLSSKWLSVHQTPTKEEKNGRGAGQVLANGGVGLFLTGVYFLSDHNEQFLFIFSISFAVALSDTLSSDVGRRYGKKVYNIINLKPVTKGLSGGITIAGCVAGLIGSFIIALLFHFIHSSTIYYILIVGAFGFAGMLIDSLLGSLIQAKYKQGQIISEKGLKKELIQGFHWVSNDWVNFLSIALTCFLAYLFQFL